jgi:hypothetical protein
MPYTSVEKIKRILNITSSDRDAILNDLLNEVHAELNLLLQKHFVMPIEDPNILAVLDGIEALWVAGRYRMLFEPSPMMTPEGNPREHDFVIEAKRRLRALIESRRAILGV